MLPEDRCHVAGVYQTLLGLESLVSSVTGLFICSAQSTLVTIVACDLSVTETDRSVAFDGGQSLQSVMRSRLPMEQHHLALMTPLQCSPHSLSKAT